VALFYGVGYFVVVLYYHVMGIPSTLASGRILPAGVLPVLMYAAVLWLIYRLVDPARLHAPGAKGRDLWAPALAALGSVSVVLSSIELLYCSLSATALTAAVPGIGAMVAVFTSGAFLLELSSRGNRKSGKVRLAVYGTLAVVATVWTTSTSFVLIVLAMSACAAGVAGLAARLFLSTVRRASTGLTVMPIGVPGGFILAGFIGILSLMLYAIGVYPNLPPHLGGGQPSRVLIKGSLGTAGDSAFFAQGLWRRLGDYYVCRLVEHAGGQYYIRTSTLKGVRYAVAIPENKVDMVLFPEFGSRRLSDEQFVKLFAGLGRNAPTWKPTLEAPPPDSASPP